MKGQGHRGRGSNLCFFLFVPLLLRSLGRSSPNLVERLRAAPDISSRGSLLKVNVIEVKGQISVSLGSLGRISPNLEGWWKVKVIEVKVKFMFLSVCSPTSQVLGQSSSNLVGRLRAAPDISSRGSFFKVHRGQRSNFCISQVLGPIFTKLGGMVEGGPGYKLEGFIF